MLFGFEGVVGFVLFALWIWALIDCISTDSERCRNLPKWIWLVIVIILFDLGAILWLLLGRPANKRSRPVGSAGDAGTPYRSRGEDRIPNGLDISDRRSAELDQELAQWEAQRQLELDAREQELGDQ